MWAFLFQIKKERSFVLAPCNQISGGCFFVNKSYSMTQSTPAVHSSPARLFTTRRTPKVIPRAGKGLVHNPMYGMQNILHRHTNSLACYPTKSPRENHKEISHRSCVEYPHHPELKVQTFARHVSPLSNS